MSPWVRISLAEVDAGIEYEPGVLVGRSPNAELIVLDDTSVSEAHAWVTVRNGRFVIQRLRGPIWSSVDDRGAPAYRDTVELEAGRVVRLSEATTLYVGAVQHGGAGLPSTDRGARLTVDGDACDVWGVGRPPCELTGKSGRLLATIATASGRSMEAEELIAYVWGTTSDNNLSNYIKRIHDKLRECGISVKIVERSDGTVRLLSAIGEVQIDRRPVPHRTWQQKFGRPRDPAD